MEINNILKNAFQPLFSNEFTDFIENINTKSITLKESDITPRIYNHWKKSGLLLTKFISCNDKRRWERLSFIDFIWLKCIDEMRALGVPFEMIKKAKDILFAENDNNADEINQYYKKVQEGNEYKYQKDRINQILDAIKNSPMNEKDKNTMQSLFQSDSFRGNLFTKQKYNYFETCLFSSIFSKQEFGIIITKEDITPFLDEILTFNNKAKHLFYNSHIYISVTKQYYNFLNDENKAKYVSSFCLLNVQENAILSFMKKEEFQKITIKKDNSDTYITGEMKIPFKEKNYEEFKKWKKKVILKYPFCQINEKRHMGKISAIEFAVKELIKK